MFGRSRKSHTVADPLLSLLGDDAFGNIYEHNTGFTRPRDVQQQNGGPSSHKKFRSESAEEDGSVEREFEAANNVVKARRRLLVSRNANDTAPPPGLAALAAQAGASARNARGARLDDRASPRPSSSPYVHDDGDDYGDDDIDDDGTEPGDQQDPDEHLDPDDYDNGEEEEEEEPEYSPARKKKSGGKKKKPGPTRTRRAASGVLINGKMVHSITGVPDEFLLDMASLPQDKRPKRCGQCGSCQNLHRKKACEVMRALGTNPPIPRGKNREKLLGTSNVKKHVPRSFGSANAEACDVTKIRHQGDGDDFTVDELERLQQALVETHPNMNHYWKRIADKVGTQSEQACFQRVYQSDAYYAERYKPKGSTVGIEEKVGANNETSDIGQLLQQRFGRSTRRVSGGSGGSRGSGGSGESGSSDVDGRAGVDHARVRDLVEMELGEGDADDSEETEDSEF